MTTFTGYLIRRAQQAHVATWQRIVSDDVTSVQFGVLMTLAEHPESSQREICDALDLDRSTIADIVQRLQRRGLIARRRDDVDRRRNTLRLTEFGESEYAALLPRVQSLDAALTRGLSATESEQLRHLLALMLEGVQTAGDPAAAGTD